MRPVNSDRERTGVRAQGLSDARLHPPTRMVVKHYLIKCLYMSTNKNTRRADSQKTKDAYNNTNNFCLAMRRLNLLATPMGVDGDGLQGWVS